MKDTGVCKRIQDLCFQMGIEYNELYERICKAIDEHDPTIGYPVLSSVNRWCNNKVDSPEAKWIPFIAIALEVSEEELKYGKDSDAAKLRNEVDRLSEMHEMDENDKEIVTRLLWLSRYHTFVIVGTLVIFGTFYLNLSIWKNPLILLLCMILIALLWGFDSRKYRKDMGITKRPGPIEEAKSNFSFIKSMFQDNFVSRFLLHYLVIIIMLAFLPFFESLFYKGSFCLTGTIYFVVAGILVLKNLLIRRKG